MFEPLSEHFSLPEIERRILEFWERERIFEKSVRRREGGPRFTLYEGPPTVNAPPGIHHTLTRIFKDVFPRYRTMKGFYAPRRAGWDAHGLPVELEVERELGISSKPEIESYGVGEFNARCREKVFENIRRWEELTKRIGFWLDLEDPYITLRKEYIESCWWIIKELWRKGLIYRDYKVTPHCPRCGTSLSSHEVALGYEEVEDPSVFVKFPLRRENLPESLASFDLPIFLLAWTTTPWTLPGNAALAISPYALYALVRRGEEGLILALDLVEKVLPEAEVLRALPAQSLRGLRYEPLFEPVFPGGERPEGMWKVVLGEFVSLEEGTGVVHIAPAYGAVDLEIGRAEGLPVIHAVDPRGVVMPAPVALTSPGEIPSDLPRKLPFAGKFVKEADPEIIKELERRDLILRAERIRHAYPFCWRCGTPLLYYAKNSWYIRTTALKEELISGNEEIDWHPHHIKHGRFGDWLEHNVDWAFSRERYWGTPLPIWACESCGAYECVGSLEELREGFERLLRRRPELKELSRSPEELEDLHRPYVDEIPILCPRCEGVMWRVPEVVDCWFDSGAMPFAQWHYPFENETIFEDGRFPADFICEAVDQTRGWFYSLHAVSTLLVGRPCFRTVLCLGHVLDERGEKMSKSKGNVVDPWEVVERWGADALRWHILTSVPVGASWRFSTSGLDEALRGFFRTLFNTYNFLATYARVDGFDPAKAPWREFKPSSPLDRWILSRLSHLVAEVDRRLERYDATGAAREIEKFVDELSNWYVRRSRRRFWKSESDREKLEAYCTLYKSLRTLALILAPLIPFTAEELYQKLVRPFFPEAPESVHLCDFPAPEPELFDEKLEQEMKLVQTVVSVGRAARSRAGIKVRQPLEELRIWLPGRRIEEPELLEEIKEELNVRRISFAESPEDLRGPDLVAAEEEGVGAAISTRIPEELKLEGLARELVRRIQNLRKSAGLVVSDRIRLYYEGEGLDRVFELFGDYIRRETLALSSEKGIPEDAFAQTFKIEGREVKLALRRAGAER